MEKLTIILLEKSSSMSCSQAEDVCVKTWNGPNKTSKHTKNTENGTFSL